MYKNPKGIICISGKFVDMA